MANANVVCNRHKKLPNLLKPSNNKLRFSYFSFQLLVTLPLVLYFTTLLRANTFSGVLENMKNCALCVIGLRANTFSGVLDL